jgi:Transglycosylase SLT domain
MLRIVNFICVLGLKRTKYLLKQLCNWERNGVASSARTVAQAWMLAACAAALMAAGMQPAYADVWGYVDAKGVAHFAAEKVDERYEIYFKGGTSFDTKDGLPSSPARPGGVTAEMPRPVNVPKLAPKLLAFFEISPSFKSVKHHLREAASTNKIDFELLQALIATESGFDTNAVSPKGAVGLMQLMPPTAQRYGVQADAKTTVEKKLTDPKTNIKAGSRYLRDLMAMFPGKPELALAAYNAGEGAVKRYGNKIPPFAETQNYVKTVMQIYTTLKPPNMLAATSTSSDKLPARVRMEMGGAVGRGNMVPPLAGISPRSAPASSPASSPAPLAAAIPASATPADKVTIPSAADSK